MWTPRPIFLARWIRTAPRIVDRAGVNEGSAAQPDASDQSLVTRRARLLEIIQQTAPLADHDEQSAPRVEILFVCRQVIGQVADALTQDGDLNLRRSGIALLRGVLCDMRLLALGGD